MSTWTWWVDAGLLARRSERRDRRDFETGHRDEAVANVIFAQPSVCFVFNLKQFP
jgi:hypothetical protein